MTIPVQTSVNVALCQISVTVVFLNVITVKRKGNMQDQNGKLLEGELLRMSPYLCLSPFLYLSLNVLRDYASIRKGSFMPTKHICSPETTSE